MRCVRSVHMELYAAPVTEATAGSSCIVKRSVSDAAHSVVMEGATTAYDTTPLVINVCRASTTRWLACLRAPMAAVFTMEVIMS